VGEKEALVIAYDRHGWRIEAPKHRLPIKYFHHDAEDGIRLG